MLMLEKPLGSSAPDMAAGRHEGGSLGFGTLNSGAGSAFPLPAVSSFQLFCFFSFFFFNVKIEEMCFSFFPLWFNQPYFKIAAVTDFSSSPCLTQSLLAEKICNHHDCKFSLKS